ncbi:Gldg family protein, partial [Treponema sp.]|uniref:Gldg family protein n=1 Tax=Treponema sp. TaxID=166 RepID=UPI00388E74DD
ILNFSHLLALYFNLPDFIAFICRKISFAWHFDSFSKGILDSRNFVYYLIISFSFNLLSANYENIRLGKKTPKLTVFLLTSILFLLSLSFSNLYVRLDLSKNKKFSVSKTSSKVIETINDNLRITYYRSEEVAELYPQVTDVDEFLSDYSLHSPKISLSIEKADAEKLKNLGIQGQQIRNDNGNKTEFITVYSAILLQYLEKSALIPFTLSTNTLEYDLTQRVIQLTTEKKRKVYLLSGNGRTIGDFYGYVSPWLITRGFETEILNEFNTTEILKNLTSEDEIVVLGTSNLTQEQKDYLEDALKNGVKAFIAVSPFNISVEDEWIVTKNSKDSLFSFLNSLGFAFENALVEDISCHTITMQSSSDGTYDSQTEYRTMNYPLWISIQPQKEAKRGASVFWASPISLYNGAIPLLVTTNFAWLQKAAESAGNEESLFLTNPFTLPKTASQSGSQNGIYTVAAQKDNVILISDQFFVSSLMTGFISGESSGDFRNYDFLTSQLLKLRGEEELASLMEKYSESASLYKLTDENAFLKMKNFTVFVTFVLLPLIIISIYMSVLILRNKRKGKLY